MRFFYLLGILGQIRCVPGNGEKRVVVFRRWFSSLVRLRSVYLRCDY